MSEAQATGGCLCGGVRYEVRGNLRQVWGCHCSQCRRTSGNFVAATRVRSSDLAFVTADTLTLVSLLRRLPSAGSAPAAAATCSGGAPARRTGTPASTPARSTSPPG